MTILKGVVDATLNGKPALYDYATQRVALVPKGHRTSWAIAGFIGIRNEASEFVPVEWIEPAPGDDVQLIAQGAASPIPAASPQ